MLSIKQITEVSFPAIDLVRSLLVNGIDCIDFLIDNLTLSQPTQTNLEYTEN